MRAALGLGLFVHIARYVIRNSQHSKLKRILTPNITCDQFKVVGSSFILVRNVRSCHQAKQGYIIRKGWNDVIPVMAQ